MQLITGVAGIYVSYLVTGIVHESMYFAFKPGSKVPTPMISHLPRKSSAMLRDFWYSPAVSHGWWEL